MVTLKDDQNVVFAHDEQILPFVLEFLTGILAVKNDVAVGYGHSDAIFTGADGDYFTALRLFFGGVGDDNSTGGFFFGGSGLDHYSIIDRLHVVNI